MMWITCVLVVSRLLIVSALECFHMNKFGVSKLVTCRGYCASISAVVVNNNLAEVNYCVPERRCLAELDSRQLTDMGSLICRGLIESAGEGAITRCRAAVCQSDGCNNYNFRTDPELNDCSIHQCSNAACHNPEELKTTIPPPGSSTIATATTPFRTEYQETEGPEVTTKDSNKFKTTGATTAANEITTKKADATTEVVVETEKPPTETAPSRSVTPSEEPVTEPKKETTAKVETHPPTEVKTEAPENITTKRAETDPPVVDNVTDEEPTLDDFATQTRGPLFVPTHFKGKDITTTFPPTVAEVTTDGAESTEPHFGSTNHQEVTDDSGRGATQGDQSITDVVDITRTPERTNRNSKFNNNFIGTSKPPNQDTNESYLMNNSFDEEADFVISNRDTIVQADTNSSAICASYLSLSLIFLVSAVIL